MKACKKSNIGVIVVFVLLVLMYVTLCCSTAANDPPAAMNKGKIADPQEEYKKLALLVGINAYPYVTPLRGTVNDVEIMRQLLVEKFGFPNDNILVLTNQRATRDGIIQGIKEHLIAKATPDSIVVFHYSGHGSQKVDDNGDETDGYDETLVSYDSGHSDPYPNRDITDDELYDLLNQLTNKTPNVTLIFDSCHSGTITRGAWLARTVERDIRPLAGQQVAKAASARGVDEGKSGMRPANARYAVISGSKTDEYSYELEINGRPYGALTWYLVEQLRKTGENTTYRDVMDQVRKNVTAKYWSQHPQLEGPGEDQLVFGDKSMPSSPYILTKGNPDGTATIEAGQVQGVTQGSVYDVYPPGTKSFGKDAKSVSKIEITDVEATFSKAKITKGGPFADASRAVEREHSWSNPVLRVYFMFEDPKTGKPAPSATLQKIKNEVAKFKHISILSAASGYDLLLREQKDEKTGKSYIITEGGDPTEISPRVAVTDPDAVSHVVTQVTHWAKWFNILGISNQTPELGLDFELKPESAAKGTAGPSEREVHLALFEGERFTMSVTNRSNRDLSIALLDLSSDGSVDVIYPEGKAQEFVAPGKTWSKTLKTTLPPQRDSVRDILKVIATTRYADFSFLKQSAVRGGPRLATTHGKAANPLEELLANAAVGTTRGVASVEVGSWTTLDKVLEVRRRK